MNLYLDTSALLKRYVLEEGSDNVDQLFSSADMIFVSLISHVEAISAFRRIWRDKQISNKEYDQLTKEIEKDFLFYSTVEINSEVIDYAKRMIRKHPLKSLDSIQLACALSIRGDIDFFVTCDEKLLTIAKKEDFKVINPAINS